MVDSHEENRVDSNLPLVTTEEFRAAMGSVCSPVTIVTTTDDSQPYGTTVSAFGSLSLSPPMVTVALDKKSGLLAALYRSRQLGINLLAVGTEGLAQQFAISGRGDFDSPEWTVAHGVPRLAGGTFMGCSIDSFTDGGDHVVVIATVHTVDVADQPPLVYYRHAFGTYEALQIESAPSKSRA